MKTAAEAYTERLAAINEMIVALQKKLSDHKAEFEKRSGNWGYVGDLGFVYEELVLIYAQIK